MLNYTKIFKIEVMIYTGQVDSNIVWQDKKQRNEIKMQYRINLKNKFNTQL